MQSLALAQAVAFHAFINQLLFGIAFAHALALFWFKDFAQIERTSHYLTPIFVGFACIDFLSGVSIWAMMGFAPSVKICLMICANCVFLLEIWRIRFLRAARDSSGDSSDSAKYVRFARVANLAYAAILFYFLVF